jgi:hypothetical protein
MVKKCNPTKAEYKEMSVSIDDPKEMKSSALAMRRKLDDTSIYSVQNVMEKLYVLVDQFAQGHEHFMTPEQCQMAKHDFEYFILLLDLAIHYSEKRDQSQEP